MVQHGFTNNSREPAAKAIVCHDKLEYRSVLLHPTMMKHVLIMIFLSSSASLYSSSFASGYWKRTWNRGEEGGKEAQGQEGILPEEEETIQQEWQRDWQRHWQPGKYNNSIVYCCNIVCLCCVNIGNDSMLWHSHYIIKNNTGSIQKNLCQCMGGQPNSIGMVLLLRLRVWFSHTISSCSCSPAQFLCNS